jgi:hypothetical protein
MLEEEANMICSQCGANNSDGATFCQKCGKGLETIEQNESTLLSPLPLPASPYENFSYTVPSSSEPNYPPPPPSIPYESISTPYEPKPPLRSHSNRRYLIVIAVLVAILLSAGFYELGQLLKGNSQGNTNTTTPTAIPVIFHFVVNANQDFPGLDTGINLTVGEHLAIEAQGWASYGYQGSTCVGTPLTNPDGQRILNGNPCAPKLDPNATLPSSPTGELLANIGQPGSSSSTGWFAIGSSYSTTISTSGRLYLLYNDTVGSYGNNSGNYQVTITVTVP